MLRVLCLVGILEGLTVLVMGIISADHPGVFLVTACSGACITVVALLLLWEAR